MTEWMGGRTPGRTGRGGSMSGCRLEDLGAAGFTVRQTDTPDP